MAFTVQDLKFGKDALDGISEKTVTVHHDTLYAGYVNKRNEIEEGLKDVDRSKANQAYSAYRALKLEETSPQTDRFCMNSISIRSAATAKPAATWRIRSPRISAHGTPSSRMRALAPWPRAVGWSPRSIPPTAGSITSCATCITKAAFGAQCPYGQSTRTSMPISWTTAAIVGRTSRHC